MTFSALIALYTIHRIAVPHRTIVHCARIGEINLCCKCVNTVMEEVRELIEETSPITTTARQAAYYVHVPRLFFTNTATARAQV